jgi:hypothetical protein
LGTVRDVVELGFLSIASARAHKPYLDQAYLKPSKEESIEMYRRAISELALA